MHAPLPTTPQAASQPPTPPARTFSAQSTGDLVELHPITAPTNQDVINRDPYTDPAPGLPAVVKPDDTSGVQNLSNLHVYHPGGTSVIRAAISLTSSCLGAGALTIPYSFAQLGLILGLVVLAINGAVTAYTLYVLVKLVNRTRCTTFEALGEKFFGNRGKIIVAIAIISMSWGFGAVYIVVIGQLFSPVLSGVSNSFLTGYWGDRMATVLFWAVFMMPFTMMRSLAKVNTAILSPIGISFIIFAMIMRIQDSGLPFSTNIVWGPSPSLGIVQAITDLKVLFSGQTVIFAIYTGLADQHILSMLELTGAGFALSAVLYLLFGVVGLAAFGENAAGNVLTNFPNPMGNWYVIMAYVAMLFVLSVAYLMLVYPTRDAILALMGYHDPMEATPRTQRLVMVVLCVTTLIVGLFVPSINLMFGIVGGLSGTAVTMIFPSVFALRSGTWTIARVGRLHVILVWLVMLYGALSGPLGTAVSVYLTIAPPSTSSSAPVAAPNATSTTLV